MSGALVGHLEQPVGDVVHADGFLPDGRLLVRGWVIGDGGEPAEVSARIDGGSRVRMLATGVRDDVFLAHAELPHAGRSGFVGLVAAPCDGDGAAPGRLVVEVRRHDGWRTLAERRIESFRTPVPDDDEPFGHRALWRTPPAPVPRRSPDRVLLASHNFNLEGAPRSLLELGTRLDAAGMALRVLGPVAGPLVELWEREDAGIGYVGEPIHIAHLDDYAQRIRRLAAVEARFAPDVVVANTLDSFWAVDLAAVLGVPAIWIIRESVDVEAYFLGRWPYAIARRALGAFERAARVVFVSHATEALYDRHVEPSRRSVIWNGLDFARADEILERTSPAAARERLGLPLGVPIVTCVGTVCQRKGQHVLLDAIARLSTRPRPPVCVLVGARPSPYLDGIADRIRALGLEGLVCLVPETRDPLLYYRASDVFACTSFEESLPRVVLEAMAFGLPIVASDVYGIPEMIDDESGWLVAPGDPVALADAIGSALDDPVRARAAGARARARARRDFEIARMGAQYADLVRTVACGPRSQGEGE